MRFIKHQVKPLDLKNTGGFKGFKDHNFETPSIISANHAIKLQSIKKPIVKTTMPIVKSSVKSLQKPLESTKNVLKSTERTFKTTQSKSILKNSLKKLIPITLISVVALIFMGTIIKLFKPTKHK